MIAFWPRNDWRHSIWI